MQSSSHFVSSFDHTIELSVTGSSAFHEALRAEPFWHEFIPAFRYEHVAQPHETWHITEADTLNYDIEQKTILSTRAAVRRIVVIIEAVFEALRQAQARYTLHGSVIVRDNKAVALLGNLSGIGKTTLAAHAAQNGWAWIGDEKFTLQHDTIIGTTRGVLNDVKTKVAAQDTLPQETTDTFPLALVCQPLVTNETEVVRFDATPDKALWVFYDEMTRDIRQVNGLVASGLPVLQSFDTPPIAMTRLKAAETLARTIPVSFLRGPQALLLEAIKTTLASAE